MAVSSTSSSAGAVLTADQMLANAKASAASSSAGKSAVQKLLAGRDDTDTVELSPVAKLLAAKTTDAAKTTSYFDSDDYLRSKVSQLKQQINLYSTLPGLDPSGGVLDNLTKEVNDLVRKQQDKLKSTQAEAAAKQAELAKQQANDYKGFSSKDLLSRSKELSTTGKIAEPVSPEAQALLDKLNKGSSVNKTA